MEDTEALRLFERSQTPLDAWPDRTLFQKTLVVLLVLLFLSGFVFGLGASPIIDEMSTAWKVVIFLWGVLFGGFVLISTSNLPFSASVKIITVLGSGLSFLANGSALREVYVFSGPAAQIAQINAPITGSSECIGLHSRPSISAEPYPGKSLSIKTTREICEKFEPRNLDGHECVRLEVETGRFGIRRMLAPLSVGTC